MNNDVPIPLLNITCDVLKSAIYLLLAAYLFFYSIWGIIILIPYGLFLVYKVAKKAGERQKNFLIRQFRDALSSMLTAMESGNTMEGSISVVIADLNTMYAGRGLLIKEFMVIQRKLSLSESLENAMLELAEHTRVREIQNFVDIFAVTKRSGGNYLNLIRAAERDLYMKLETKREIDGIIASASMEANIMRFMPLAIIFYMNLFSKGFLEPLYTTLVGRIVMLVVCVLYLALGEYCERLVASAGKE